MRQSLLLGFTLLAWLASHAAAADLKIFAEQTAGDLSVALLSESGQWSTGTNAFVLQLTRDGKPVDAGKVSLGTSMAMPGMAPMIAGAKLQPDGPGNYRGTISFPDRGPRQVTVAWDGPAGKGSTKFTVRVR
jgi:hypothetical protein